MPEKCPVYAAQRVGTKNRSFSHHKGKGRTELLLLRVVVSEINELMSLCGGALLLWLLFGPVGAECIRVCCSAGGKQGDEPPST